MTEEHRILVFVYGTLKSGCHGAGKFVSKGHTHDTFVLFDGGFPMVGPKDAKAVSDIKPRFYAKVKGEVYSVDERGLQYLDHYEGYPSHYNRIQIPVSLDTGSDVKAWMYIGSEESLRHRKKYASPIFPDENDQAEWPLEPSM